ncbi:MAG: nucleotidyl transferase AbiEii/AbiGii toxin family protein [Myxococcota bacterium]|nr:nucleotidyl transferase AbiEii/AbiGii toxin family protein [Myxococcota bacterium]
MADTGPISEAQLRALDKLSKIESLQDFYLGGGTAVAYHLGHRTSRDLDLFSNHRTADLELIHTHRH